MPEFEIVRYHCHGKKAHHTKPSRNKHGGHGCTPAAGRGRRMTPGGGGLGVTSSPGGGMKKKRRR